jgi:hypothetical protein
MNNEFVKITFNIKGKNKDNFNRRMSIDHVMDLTNRKINDENFYDSYGFTRENINNNNEKNDDEKKSMEDNRKKSMEDDKKKFKELFKNNSEEKNDHVSLSSITIENLPYSKNINKRKQNKYHKENTEEKVFRGDLENFQCFNTSFTVNKDTENTENTVNKENKDVENTEKKEKIPCCMIS